MKEYFVDEHNTGYATGSLNIVEFVNTLRSMGFNRVGIKKMLKRAKRGVLLEGQYYWEA